MSAPTTTTTSTKKRSLPDFILEAQAKSMKTLDPHHTMILDGLPIHFDPPTIYCTDTSILVKVQITCGEEGGPSPTEQLIRNVEQHCHGNTIIFVLDCSASMTGARHHSLLQMLKASLSIIDQKYTIMLRAPTQHNLKDKVIIIAFDHQCRKVLLLAYVVESNVFKLTYAHCSDSMLGLHIVESNVF